MTFITSKDAYDEVRSDTGPSRQVDRIVRPTKGNCGERSTERQLYRGQRADPRARSSPSRSRDRMGKRRPKPRRWTSFRRCRSVSYWLSLSDWSSRRFLRPG